MARDEASRSTRRKVVLEAVRTTEGVCPYYTCGEKVVWYGGKIDTEESDDLCMAMLCTFAPFWRPLARGKTPQEIGMCEDGDVGYFTCHVCPVGSTPPRQSHANVLFKVTTRPITEADVKAGKTTAHGPDANRVRELRQRGLWYPPRWPIEGV
jgi:uncharacterized repeat protein (TIGR04076 family)